MPLNAIPATVLAASLFLLAGVESALWGVVLGQVDDFSDGTTQGWGIGIGAANPFPVPDGGPLGAGDGFLRYDTNGGGGEASRMVVLNRQAQWSGDFLAEGITAIQMDVINLGASPMILRVGFNVLFGPTGSWYVSAEGVELAPASGWSTITLPIGEAHLTGINPNNPALPPAQSHAQVMSDVRGVRILSAENADFRGDALVGSIGIDNIRAIPEPNSLPLFAATGLAFLRRRR